MKKLSFGFIGSVLVCGLLVGGSFGVGTAANAVAFSQVDEPLIAPTSEPPTTGDEVVDPPVDVPEGEPETPTTPPEVDPPVDIPIDPPTVDPIDEPDGDTGLPDGDTGLPDGEGEPIEEPEDPIEEPEEPEIPVIVGAVPTISGTAQAGKTVTVKTGTWTPVDVKLTYQWLRDGKNISGATKASYKVLTGDRGKKLTVKVTGKFPDAVTVSKVSKVATVLKALTAKTPTIGGTSKWHKWLSVKPTGWTSGTKFTYQWLRNGKVVAGTRAQKSSFQIHNADWCQTLTVKVTGKKAGHETRSVVSKKLTNAGCPKADYHRIYVGQRLDSGKQIASKNWKHALKIATNGNGYLYNHGRARWAAPTSAASGAKMFLTPDGNLVIKKGNTIKWQSKTAGKKVKYAAITATGELGLYTSSGKRVWTASGNNAYRWNNWGVPNLNQNDGRWAGATVGYYRFGPVACVPTAFAMAAQSYGVNVNPYQVGVVMNSRGDFNQGVAGAGGRSIKAAATQYGLNATPLYSEAAIKKALKNNQPVIGLVSGPYSITSPGSTHAIVLNNVYNGNKTTVHNPWGGYTATYSISTLWAYQSWDSLDRNAGAVFWAIG